MAWTRRDLLRRSAALGLAAGALPLRPARAEVDRRDLKFIFLIVHGGWDPTRVFTDTFDNPNVSMDLGAEPAAVGDLRWVHHPDRPSVSDFFERRAERCLILNGLVVPSVSHSDCTQLSLAGTNIEAQGDWPALLAQAQADRYPMPHAVIHGPSIPGRYAGLVTRISSNGYIEELLTGELMRRHDQPLDLGDEASRALLDRYVAEQAQAAAEQATHPDRVAAIEALRRGDERAHVVEGLVDQVRWGRDQLLSSQIYQAVDLLKLGLSRCVTISNNDLLWDSHALNDEKQSYQFERLFIDLELLMAELEATTGVSGGPLSEEVVVVMMSEMGRTPYLNSGLGKDHWGHTSALIVGPGFSTGRTVGGFTEYFYGANIDPLSGERFDGEGSKQLRPLMYGATLLAAGDVDPEPLLREESPVEGWLD
ncbi:MAG: DUF1501 domain-containing protein [Alphaproteobacteria bacterium]|nr:DUF1501 domain-containing protein [Alphaproteobacteria bacterium]